MPMPLTANGLSATLFCRYFYAGDAIRGVLRIQRAISTSSASASDQVEFVAAQLHGHVTVDTNLLSLPVVNSSRPQQALNVLVLPSMDTISSSDHGNHPSTAGATTAAAASATTLESVSLVQLETLKHLLPQIATPAENAACIHQSPAFVLLTPQEITKAKRVTTKQFAIPLPKNLCPSFRGTSAKVVYVLSISAITTSKKTFSVHLPLEVWQHGVYSFQEQTFRQHTPRGSSTTIPTLRQPPALDSSATSAVKPAGMLPRINSRIANNNNGAFVPIGLRKGQDICFELRSSLMHGRLETELFQRAQSSVFTIGQGKSHLVRLLLTKQWYHPGETILVQFDFSKSCLKCLQVSCALVCEEKTAQMALAPQQVVHRKQIDGFSTLTSHATQTFGKWCLPLDAMPSVTTDLVGFGYVLKFEFVLLMNVNGEDNNESKPQSPKRKAAPPRFRKQTFQWQLPIVVKPFGQPEGDDDDENKAINGQDDRREGEESKKTSGNNSNAMLTAEEEEAELLKHLTKLKSHSRKISSNNKFLMGNSREITWTE